MPVPLLAAESAFFMAARQLLPIDRFVSASVGKTRALGFALLLAADHGPERVRARVFRGSRSAWLPPSRPRSRAKLPAERDKGPSALPPRQLIGIDVHDPAVALVELVLGALRLLHAGGGLLAEHALLGSLSAGLRRPGPGACRTTPANSEQCCFSQALQAMGFRRRLEAGRLGLALPATCRWWRRRRAARRCSSNSRGEGGG